MHLWVLSRVLVKRLNPVYVNLLCPMPTLNSDINAIYGNYLVWSYVLRTQIFGPPSAHSFVV
jgi:hypothetical protein